MTDETNGAATDGGPSGRRLIGPPHAHLDAPCTDACYEPVPAPEEPPAGPSDVQQLVALDGYMKALKPQADALRVRVTEQMAADDDERKAAKLPDGTKIGAVSWRKGSVTAHVTDEAAALAWCLKEHPENIMQAIRPGFLSMLLDLAKKAGYGYDPATGQALDWIKVGQGAPGVTVTTTPEGKAFAASLVNGFGRLMLEGPRDGEG